MAGDTPTPEAPFETPWQAQAFALAVALNARGAFTWPEWSTALGAALAEAPDAPYWERWLAALERLTAGAGLAAESEMAERTQAWRRAYEATPHGQPVALGA